MNPHPDENKALPATEARTDRVPPSQGDPPSPLNLQPRWLIQLLEHGPQPFAAVDRQSRLVGMNQAFCDLLGYSREELLGKSVVDLSLPEYQSKTERYHAEILTSGGSTRLVKAYRRKDGSIVPVELIVDVYHDDDGQSLGVYAFVTDITERVRTEGALRESERRFRELYDEAPVGYHEIDQNGRIVSINRTACELLGYSAEELLGREVADLIDPSQREAARETLARKLLGHVDLVPYQQTLVARNGRKLEVEIQEREHHDDDGQVIGLRSVIQDISLRRQAELALIESERRARALFEGIHDALFVHDRDGWILDANPAACRQLGYTREELLRMNTSQIDAPGFAEQFKERLGKQLDAGRLNCEGMHRDKRGRLIPIELTTSLIQYDNDIAVLAIFRDITERKILERTRREFAEAQARNGQEMERKNQAITESEARYRQLAEGSLDAIVVANDEGRVTLFNPAAEKIFGYKSSDVMGQPLERLIPGVAPAPEPAEGTTEEAAAAGSPPAETKETPDGEASAAPASTSSREPLPSGDRMRLSPMIGKTVELRGKKRDGVEFPLELSLSAVRMDGRAQYIGSIRDQTERHRMRAMLAQTDKLASIGLLSAGVAHEINNPLAYILNNLVVLQREVTGLIDLVKLHEQSRESLREVDPAAAARIDALMEEIDWEYTRDNLNPMIERTRAGVKRVASIVEKMRGLARTSPLRWETVSVSDLVEGALEFVRGRIKHQPIEVAVQIHGDIQLECVPDQISQVLLNLLINAVQAVEGIDRPEGGRVEIDCRLADPMVEISISDNGPGIDLEHRDRLFDPFFTTKPVGEGTGLGLAIVHGIVSGHGGLIEVESRPGAGCRFLISLPRQAQRDQAGPQIPRTLSVITHDQAGDSC